MQARVRQTCHFVVVALGLVVVLAGTILAQPSDSSVGTWKINPAKSTYAAGTAPKSVTTKHEVAGAGVNSTVDSVDADGTVRHWTYASNYDGKDNSITGNCPYGDSIARTRVDANTTRAVYKNGGTVTATQTSVVSSDGKSRTVTTTGTNAKGQAVNSVVVYDKQ
jgi:hypothetical protein